MSEIKRPSTVREAYVQASSFLSSAGSGQSPERVAQLLLEHITGYSRSELLLRWNEPFQSEWLDRWKQGLSRKAAGEPIQYIVGEQEFYGFSFQVNPAVLIPRPETEVLVEAVMRIANQHFAPQEALIAADIGTGSGAIAVTLAKLCPAWRVWATDLSQAALEVAQQNADRLGAAGQLRFACGDLLQPIISEQERVDILVSNPPYIPSGHLPGLQREVKEHEPMSALDGGRDGLDLYRRLVEQVLLLPTLPKLIALETGSGQAREVARLLASSLQLAHTEIVADLAGIERHVIAMT